MGNKVFVYGSLKRGQPNHHYLEGAKFIGEHLTGKGYTLHVDGLPFLVKDGRGPGCFGELYLVDNETLRQLDKLEGHPTFYTRSLIAIYDSEVGMPIENVYVYLYNHIQELKNTRTTGRF